jgi:putative ATP-binding cassette transporter
MLYRLMETRLPEAAIVSIGHRTSLRAFHRRFMTLKPIGDGIHELVPAADLENVA